MKMCIGKTSARYVGAALAGAVAFGGTAIAQTVKIGVPTFLTGAGAPAFGIPAKNGAELIARGINNGELPAPYNTKGLAGRQIKLMVYDESGAARSRSLSCVTKFKKIKLMPSSGTFHLGPVLLLQKSLKSLRFLQSRASVAHHVSLKTSIRTRNTFSG